MKYSEELSVFIEVARRGSFAAAARILNLPTTTISRKLQQLEYELDVKLFNRTTRSLSLTEVGERLLPKATMVVEMVEELKSEAEYHSVTPIGTLNISAPSRIFELFSPLFSEFMHKFPGIRFVIDSSSRYRDLTSTRADFAFRLGPLNDSSIFAIPLAKVRYLLVASRELIAKDGNISHPKELNSRSCIRNQIEGLLLPWRFNIDGELFELDSQYSVLSDDLSVSAQLAVNGAGFAYLPIELVKKYIDQGELISIGEDWLPASRDLYLVYSDKKNLPSKSRKFIEFVKSNRSVIEAVLLGENNAKSKTLS